MLLHWYGVEPGDWPMSVYRERADRIADIREMTESFDRKDPEYQKARIERLEARRKRAVRGGECPARRQ